MKATIVINRYDREFRQEVLEQWNAQEILPAHHQEKFGNGKYVMVQKPQYTNLYDVRVLPNYNFITWLLKTVEDYYGSCLINTIITNLE